MKKQIYNQNIIEMLLSNRSTNSRKSSARLSSLTEQRFELASNNDLSLSKRIQSNNNGTKIEFRKVLKPRNKHSRVGENDKESEISLTQRRFSKQRMFPEQQFLVKKKQKEINKSESNFKIKSKVFEQSSETINSVIIPQKHSLIQRLRETSPKKNPFQNQQKHQSRKNDQIQQYQKMNQQTARLSISRKQSMNLMQSRKNLMDLNEDKASNSNVQNKKTREISNMLRPQSSTSNFSSVNKQKRSQRKISELDNFYMSQQRVDNAEKQTKKTQYLKLQELIAEFISIEQRINSLITDKWKLIEEKLSKQKQSSHAIILKPQLEGSKGQKLSLQRIKQSQQKKQEKYSFSLVIAQKNIDIEIMNQIKNLRNLNFTQISLPQRQIEKKEVKSVLEQLQNRRYQIIEKVLAQSLVQADLLKKYYSGQNAQGLSTSNHKVGQRNLKQKMQLLSRKKIEQKSILQNPRERPSQVRQYMVDQSESKSNFIRHNEQDYEKYRYQQPLFKPNMQPLPRSSYKRQFFDYSNVPFFNPICKQENSMIFPTTSTLKNSSYRNQYKQFSPQRINYKQLDAYQDKFKQIDITYLPKKRSESEAYNSRKGSKGNKHISQLDYVKKLKTESIVGSQKQKITNQKLAMKMFSTEMSDEYQNPEKLLQHYGKSQIKHKNLQLLKYDMKKKFHI